MNANQLAQSKWYKALTAFLGIYAVISFIAGFLRLTGLYRMFYHVTSAAQEDIDRSAYLHPLDLVFGLVCIAVGVLMLLSFSGIKNRTKKGLFLLHISFAVGIAASVIFIITYNSLVINDLTLSVRYYYIRTNVYIAINAILLSVILIVNLVFFRRCKNLFS